MLEEARGALVMAATENNTEERQGMSGLLTGQVIVGRCEEQGKRGDGGVEREPRYRMEEVMPVPQPKQESSGTHAGGRGGGGGGSGGENLNRRTVKVVIDVPAMMPAAGAMAPDGGQGASGSSPKGLRPLDFELDMEPRLLRLRVPEVYRLSLDLPFSIDADGVTARFSKKRATLTVTAQEM